MDNNRQLNRNSRRDTLILPGTHSTDLLELYTDKFYNVFFSLYSLDVNGDESCFYVSEVVERTINPNFQELKFDSSRLSRSTNFKLKIWISTYKSPKNFKLLLDIPLDLSKLIYLNKELDNIPSLKQNNTILISLFDGIYLLPTKDYDINEYKSIIFDEQTPRNIIKTVPSFTYDLIMKINNLNSNIEDVSNSKLKVSKQIEIISKNEYYDDSLSNHHFKMNRTNTMIQQSIAFIQLQKTTLQDLKDLKEIKTKSILKFKQTQNLNKDNLILLKQEYSDLLSLDENIKNDLILIKNEKIRELINIFPKEEIYQWLKIQRSSYLGTEYQFLELLPIELNLNSLTNLINISDQQLINQINAGFGYLAEIVFLASRYLGTPLRYQIRPFGSTSYIVDKISEINQRKTFPLFYTDHFYRFQYAVILLNRNIQDLLKEDSLIRY